MRQHTSFIAGLLAIVVAGGAEAYNLPDVVILEHNTNEFNVLNGIYLKSSLVLNNRPVWLNGEMDTFIGWSSNRWVATYSGRGLHRPPLTTMVAQGNYEFSGWAHNNNWDDVTNGWPDFKDTGAKFASVILDAKDSVEFEDAGDGIYRVQKYTVNNHAVWVNKGKNTMIFWSDTQGAWSLGAWAQSAPSILYDSTAWSDDEEGDHVDPSVGWKYFSAAGAEQDELTFTRNPEVAQYFYTDANGVYRLTDQLFNGNAVWYNEAKQHLLLYFVDTEYDNRRWVLFPGTDTADFQIWEITDPQLRDDEPVHTGKWSTFFVTFNEDLA